MEKIIKAIINGHAEVDLQDESTVDMIKNEDGSYHVLAGDQSHQVNVLEVNRSDKKIRLKIDEEIYQIDLLDEVDVMVDKMGLSEMKNDQAEDCMAPMPGLVLSVEVSPGTSVDQGQPLLILEAMKMENVIKAAHDGVVDDILVDAGDKVEKGQRLLTYKTD